MTTLAELSDGVYRDLADEAKQVFSVAQVEDFVRAGIADLNRVAPTDGVEVLDLVKDVDGKIIQFEYDTLTNLPYRVEVRRLSDGYAVPMPEAGLGQTVSSGYVFWQTASGGHIELPQYMIEGLNHLDTEDYALRLYGYQYRPLPYTVEGQESPTVPLSPEDEYVVRAYAKSAGFDLLAHDRSLYQQWQGQSNNTDVSPTQITQMAYNAKREWEKVRGAVRVVRRYW